MSANIDISRALSKLVLIRDAVSDKAVVRALNKTADQAKVQSSREIQAAGYGLKASAIKKNISIKRAGKSELVAVVRATGRPVALINYSARQTKAGVTVAVKNGRKLVRGAFIATMSSGHTGVFERLGAGHKKVMRDGKVQWQGMPIRELFGPSIPSAFMNQVVQTALIDAINEKFPRLLQHELKYLRLKG